MNFIRVLLAVTVMLFGAVSAHAQAVSGQGTWETTLQARDVGNTGTTNAFYDTALNITWLRDANVNGLMTWDAANTWASSLNIGGVGGWRLPTLAMPSAECGGGSPNIPVCGYYGNPSYGEMFQLYFTTLGHPNPYNSDGSPHVGWYASVNTGNFQDLLPDTYWLGTEYASQTDGAWQIGMADGSIFAGYKSQVHYTMAVHPGDVGAVVANVPEPETYAMLLAGLGLIGAVARRRHADKPLVAKS